MRRSYYYIILFLFVITGCEDIFQEPAVPIADIQNNNQLIDAAEGAWAKLAWAMNYPNHLSLYYQNLKADDITFRGASYHSFYNDENSCSEIPESDRFMYSQYTPQLYKSLYLVIASANNIIVQFPYPGEEDQFVQEVIGEMLLLRSYCHYRLTRTYGQIPLVKNIDVDYSLSKPSFVQIYEFIESDLRRAENLLPANSQLSRMPGKRPGKGSTKALLAELYLSWAGYPINDASKYSSAAIEAGALIDSADYYGFGLLTDFANLWDSEHSVNKESTLCLYYSDIENISDLDQINQMYSTTIHPGFFEVVYLPPEFDPITYIKRSSKREVSFFAAELYFFNHYPPCYRKDITFFTDIYVPPRYLDSPEVDTGCFHIDTLSQCDRAAYRKFNFEETRSVVYSEYLELGGNSKEYTPMYFGNTQVYIYRFAHTLLTYAEAKARSGQLDESAYEAVNRIRRRANNMDLFAPSKYDLTPGLSAEVFADSVVWERAWELAGEPEGRYFDLLRLEKLEDIRNYRHPQENSPPWKSITRDEYFLPIPEEDVLLNPKLY